MSDVKLKEFSWDRMIAAANTTRERARRITAALDCAGIKYSVIADSAIAAWVARIDVEAVRNTKDVDILIRRDDLPKLIEVASDVGFLHQNVNGIDLLLDGPEGSVRSAVHIVFAGERVRADHPLPAPDVTESEPGPDFKIVKLDALVRMKLTAFRLKDKVHLLDLLDVGLIDATWVARLPPPLAERLQEVLATRELEL